MISYLKVLGLALAAVFVLSAIAASAAWAQNGKITSDGPVTLKGAQTGAASENALSAFGGETQCPNAADTAHKYAVTPHEFIPPGAETVTVTPHLGQCTALGFPSTIDMNGCDYVYHLEQRPFSDAISAKVTIVCTAGQHITVTIFGSAAKHTENKPFCHITITENAAGYTGLTLTDTTNGVVDLTGTITGISADKKSPTGSILCPEETTSTASLKQDLQFSGLNSVGGTTAISLTT